MVILCIATVDSKDKICGKTATMENAKLIYLHRIANYDKFIAIQLKKFIQL